MTRKNTKTFFASEYGDKRCWVNLTLTRDSKTVVLDSQGNPILRRRQIQRLIHWLEYTLGEMVQ